MNWPDDELIDTGSWDEHEVTWKLFATSKLPPLELCTAVMCVAIAEDAVVLARSKRGWGMLGGHIEAGETCEATLFREALEEGGFVIDTHSLFAIREITSTRPMPHQQVGKLYPYPTSYMAYYWATTEEPLIQPSGDDIIESRSFSIEEMRKLNTTDQFVIEAGWDAWLGRSNAVTS